MTSNFYILSGAVASIIAIIGGCVACWRWSRRFLEFRYRPKPFHVPVERDFNYYDIHAGISELVSYANEYGPDFLIGINRGGAIIGGIIGKHIHMYIDIIEVSNHRTSGITVHVPEHLRNVLPGKKAFLLDDRYITGTNMNAGYNEVKRAVGSKGSVRRVVFVLANDSIGSKHGLDKFAYRAVSHEVPLPWEPNAARTYLRGNLLRKIWRT